MSVFSKLEHQFTFTTTRQRLDSSPSSNTTKAEIAFPWLRAGSTTYHSATGLAMLSKITSCFAS